MKERVRRKFEAVRAALAAVPDSYMFAEFQPGSRDPMPDIPEGLRDLLTLADGLRAGWVVVFPYRELDRNQFHLDDADTVQLMGGDRDRWLCFGLVDDFPLVMERPTGAIWWFPELWLEYSFMATRFERLADDVDDFVDRFLLGEGYARLTGSRDWWWDFQRDHGLVAAE